MNNLASFYNIIITFRSKQARRIYSEICAFESTSSSNISFSLSCLTHAHILDLQDLSPWKHIQFNACVGKTGPNLLRIKEQELLTTKNTV